MKPAMKHKRAVVTDITNKIKSAQSTTIVHYHGLSVNDLDVLRQQLEAQSCKLQVFKNTLMKIAFANLGITIPDATLEGPNALVFANADELSSLGILYKFAKEHRSLLLKSAILSNEIVTDKKLKALAKVGSKDALMSMLIGSLMTVFANLASIFEALKNKLETEGEGNNDRKQ